MIIIRYITFDIWSFEVGGGRGGEGNLILWYTRCSIRAVVPSDQFLYARAT